jgi:ferredoxin-thioredoxin reductase catalytic subunit
MREGARQRDRRVNRQFREQRRQRPEIGIASCPCRLRQRAHALDGLEQVITGVHAQRLTQ